MRASTGQVLNFTQTQGLSWDSTASFYQPSAYNLTSNGGVKIFPPPFWQNQKRKLDLNPDGSYRTLPDISQDAAFQAWMTVAGMNIFRKLYGYYNDGPLYPDITYKVSVLKNVFTVAPFEGRKYIVFTNNSWLGGKSSSLGITYLVIGCLILAIASVLLLCYLIKPPRKLGDLSRLSWRQEQQSRHNLEEEQREIRENSESHFLAKSR